MMNLFKKALCQTQTSLVLEHCQFFSPKHPSPNIIQQLQSPKEKEKLKLYLRTVQNHSLQLRMLALISCLLVHGQGFEQIVQESLVVDEDLCDEWLHGKILSPYKQILKRYSETSEFFCLASKSEISNDKFMQNLPYLVVMLKQLCVIAYEIDKLGRYFTASENQMGLSSVFFSEAFIVFTNKFYSYLRLSLQSYLQMLRRNKHEITAYRQILRWFFGQVLPKINEPISRLNHSKYLDFKSKGMTIKLFIVEEQSSVIEGLISQIMKKDESQEEQLQELQSMIFPEDGSFNQEIFLQVLSEQAHKLCQISDNSTYCLSPMRKHSSLATTQSDSLSFIQ